MVRPAINMISLAVLSLLLLSSSSSLHASEETTCRPYTGKELDSIRSSNNHNLIMGAGVEEVIVNPKSPIGKELLDLGSRLESPKGVATVSLIANQWNPDLPLRPVRESIEELLRDDKDNALSYYLSALLKREEGSNQEALEQLKKGNKKIFNSYLRERFNLITQAGEMAKCGWQEAREHALWNSLSTAVYIRLRHLCRDLIKNYGQSSKDACSILGNNLERTSLTCIDKLISLSIQSDALDELPSNEPARAAIKIKRDKASACGERRIGTIEETDVTKDAALQYYEILLENGEASAQDFLSDFVKRRHQKK